MSVSEPKDYLTTTNELTSIANTIRTKFGLSGNLVYPSDYIDNINTIKAYDISGYLEGTISEFSDSNISATCSYAFAYCSNLTNVSLPNCSTIGGFAFAYCNSLSTAYLPSCSVISGGGAFYLCSLLSSLVLDSSRISSIPANTFNYCYLLSCADFPACTYIDYSAFAYCSSLSSVNFPQCNVLSFGVFRQCSNLSQISFPICTTIGTNAFVSCYQLSGVELPSCTVLFSNAFAFCSSLSYVDILHCQILSNSAFYCCQSLESVDFPELSSIYANAFALCYNLTDVSLHNYNSSTHIVNLENSNAFSSTPIDGYTGSTSSYGKIYVNDMDYSAYISSTNWTYYSSHIFPVGANLYSTSAVYLSSNLSIPSYMESFSTSSFSFANSIGSVFNSFKISYYSQVYYDNYLVYDGYWNDDTGQEITFQTDSFSAYPPEFVKWFYLNQSYDSGGGDDGVISDLTNTGWFFSSSINYPEGVEYEQYYNISFTTRDNATWTGIKILPNSYIQYVSSYGVSTTAYSGSWTNNDFRYINNINGADVTDSMLIEFITTNASQTHSWVFNDSTLYLTEATSSGTTTWNIEFYPTGNYTSDNKFIALRLNPTGFDFMSFTMYYTSSNSDILAYQTGYWNDNVLKSITITTGTDKDNPDLLEFLQQNATQIN